MNEVERVARALYVSFEGREPSSEPRGHWLVAAKAAIAAIPNADAIARITWSAEDLKEAAGNYANDWLLDERENAELCYSPEHHAQVVALFDAIEDMNAALAKQEPGS